MTNKYATYGSDATQANAGIANGLRETTGPTNLTMAGVADGEFLKRSGSTIISAVAGTGWTTAYSVDFSTLSSQNIKTGGNGAKTIDGNSWTWANDANASAANVTSGTGIVISLTAANSGYNGATRTAPLLRIQAASLFPSYNVFKHIIRVTARVLLTNCDSNTEGVLVGFEDDTAPTNQSYTAFKGFWGGADGVFSVSNINGVVLNSYTSRASFADDLISIALAAPTTWNYATGVYSAPPLVPSTDRYGQIQAMGTPLLIVPTQPDVVMAVQSGNTAGATTVTITHLQIDYVSRCA